MQAGTLRKRITIEQRSTSIDGVGGQSETWSTVAVVWASLEPAKGRELLAAQAMHIDQPMTITMRYQAIFSDPKAVAAMRAVYNGRIFDIHSANNQEERNRILVLLASEGMTNG